MLYPLAEHLLKIDSTKLSLDEKYRKLDELSKLVVELADKTAELVPRCGKFSKTLSFGLLKNCTTEQLFRKAILSEISGLDANFLDAHHVHQRIRNHRTSTGYLAVDVSL